MIHKWKPNRITLNKVSGSLIASVKWCFNSGTELKKEEFANTMMVNTSIDSGAAPVSYVNEEFLVARDRSDGMSSIVYRNEVTA